MELSLSAYADITDRTAQSPVILHAPHGGTRIPASVRDQFILDGEELRAEQDAMTDHCTDDLVRTASEASGASAVINQLSRLVVDVERFNDKSEEKNAVGQGVLYTHGTRRQEIRRLPEDVSALMRFYNEYAVAVTRLCEKALARHGYAVILDVHSYTTVALGHELHTHEPRPELCIGYEEPHCRPALREQVRRAFDDWQQGDNETFHGSYVPLPYYGSEPCVQSVMLEIRRDQYLDELTFTPDAANVDTLAKALTRLTEAAPGAMRA